MATMRLGRLPEERVERALQREDGRRVVWAETGHPQGQYVVRLPGAPASRLQLPTNFKVWDQLGLRMVMTERPGYGESSPRVGYSVADYADDLAALLDVLQVDRVPVAAYGVGAVYGVAFAATHPDRVCALSIVGGQGMVVESDLEPMIPINRGSWAAVLRQDRAELTEMLGALFKELDDDPLGGTYGAVAGVPESDWRQIVKIDWQRRWAADVAEALQNGVSAWVEDSLTMGRGWAEIAVEKIRCPITWFHAAGDKNASLAAARRTADRMPTARLVEWSPIDGSLVTPEHEAEALNSLFTPSGGCVRNMDSASQM